MNQNEHLNHSQLIMAVIDENDLNRAGLDHLNSCKICRQKIDQFKMELNVLEQKADSTAPLPSRKPTLPKPDIVSFRFFKPVFAACMMAVVLIAFMWWPANKMQLAEETTAQILLEMEADEKLMAEIEELEGIALSGMYLESSEDNEDLIEEDFMDFLVPVEDDFII